MKEEGDPHIADPELCPVPRCPPICHHRLASGIQNLLIPWDLPICLRLPRHLLGELREVERRLAVSDHNLHQVARLKSLDRMDPDDFDRGQATPILGGGTRLHLWSLILMGRRIAD